MKVASKEYKLPKELWVKGKSKFLVPRLIEENIIYDAEDFGFPWWTDIAGKPALWLLYKKLGKL